MKCLTIGVHCLVFFLIFSPAYARVLGQFRLGRKELKDGRTDRFRYNKKGQAYIAWYKNTFEHIVALVGKESAFHKAVIHDNLSPKFSFDICEDEDPSVPDRVRVFDRFDKSSLVVGLNNSGYEYMVNDDATGFGVYPTHIRGQVIVKGWDKRSGEMVSIDVDLLSGNVSPRSAKYKVNKVATLCPVDIATVSKRGFTDIALFALRSACNSLLSPYAWTECRPYINSICVSVAVTLEVANPIPGDYAFWYPACQVALSLACGQVGNIDPISTDICDQVEDYITDRLG